jgi:hypothetical protein
MPVWRENRQSQDINITARYGDTPVIDSFQYFNGFPGKKTVAQSQLPRHSPHRSDG